MYHNLNAIKKPILIIGVSLSILFLFLALYSGLLLKWAIPNKEILFLISRFSIWLVLALLFFYVSKVEKSPFLIWKETEYSLKFSAAALLKTILKLFLVVYLVGILSLLFHLKTKSAHLTETLTLFHKNFFLLFFTCVTAGVTEELIFRGYLLPRLEILLKNTKLAILISSILFGILHYGYGTLIHVLGPVLMGIVFAMQYQKYRNIKIVIVAHFLWDLIVLVLNT